MRLQHLKQVGDGLPAGDPARAAAKAVIVAEVERLHWRIWSGKAKNARQGIDRSDYPRAPSGALSRSAAGGHYLAEIQTVSQKREPHGAEDVRLWPIWVSRVGALHDHIEALQAPSLRDGAPQFEKDLAARTRDRHLHAVERFRNQDH
jgi:hypothetical protein